MEVAPPKPVPERKPVRFGPPVVPSPKPEGAGAGGAEAPLGPLAEPEAEQTIRKLWKPQQQGDLVRLREELRKIAGSPAHRTMTVDTMVTHMLRFLEWRDRDPNDEKRLHRMTAATYLERRQWTRPIPAEHDERRRVRLPGERHREPDSGGSVLLGYLARIGAPPGILDDIGGEGGEGE